MNRSVAIPVLAVLVAIVSLAGCGLLPSPSPAAVIPAAGDVKALPIVLVDPAGLVRTVVPGGPDVGFDRGVEPIAGSQTAAVVRWIGGVCDIRTSVTVTLRGTVIEIKLSTEAGFGGCVAAGVFRTITIDFSQPIGGQTLDLVVGS